MKLTPFLLLAATPILAASTLDQRISTLEQQMDNARMTSVYGNNGANTAAATPANDRYGPFVSLEMLYFQPFVGGTEFAYTDNAFPVAAPYYGHIAQVDFDWQVGFRTAFGYQFSDFDWALSAEYTRLAFDQTEHVPGGRGLSASGLPSNASRTSAKAKWSMAFNVFDIDLARAYFLRPCLSVNPRIGIRTAWINQHDHAQYFIASTEASTLLKYATTTAGAGILGGTGLSWHWSNQWSLSSNVIASLIYGKMEVGAKSTNSTPATLIDLSDDTYKFLPNASVDAALQWEMSWHVVRFSMAAGYEFQYWWRQNQRPHFDTGTAYSWIRHAEDIGFQGFKLRAALDF